MNAVCYYCGKTFPDGMGGYVTHLETDTTCPGYREPRPLPEGLS